jgi:hypothetical protein
MRGEYKRDPYAELADLEGGGESVRAAHEQERTHGFIDPTKFFPAGAPIKLHMGVCKVLQLQM